MTKEREPYDLKKMQEWWDMRERIHALLLSVDQNLRMNGFYWDEVAETAKEMWKFSKKLDCGANILNVDKIKGMWGDE